VNTATVAIEEWPAAVAALLGAVEERRRIPGPGPFARTCDSPLQRVTYHCSLDLRHQKWSKMAPRLQSAALPAASLSELLADERLYRWPTASAATLRADRASRPPETYCLGL
jgi:hypothetical protein